MKDGKIDVKSVGITIVLAVIGVGVGFWDFISQRVNVMNFLSEVLKIKSSPNFDLSMSTNTLNAISFANLSLLVLVVAILAIACAMYSIRGMA